MDFCLPDYGGVSNGKSYFNFYDKTEHGRRCGADNSPDGSELPIRIQAQMKIQVMQTTMATIVAVRRMLAFFVRAPSILRSLELR